MCVCVYAIGDSTRERVKLVPTAVHKPESGSSAQQTLSSESGRSDGPREAIGTLEEP